MNRLKIFTVFGLCGILLSVPCSAYAVSVHVSTPRASASTPRVVVTPKTYSSKAPVQSKAIVSKSGHLVTVNSKTGRTWAETYDKGYDNYDYIAILACCSINNLNNNMLWFAIYEDDNNDKPLYNRL